MMKAKLLFVDDEPFFSQYYVKALEASYEVVYSSTVKEALEVLHRLSDLRLVVLDIMMPPPEPELEESTLAGLDTGLWFLREQMQTLVSRQIAAVVLTNRNKQHVEDYLRLTLAYPGNLYVVRSKIETPHFLLPAIVKRFGL